MDSTSSFSVVSFMDTFSHYNQIWMAKKDKEKMAFITSQGLFYYKVMSFRLKNARATYQRLVNKVFTNQLNRNKEAYVDDMIIKSKSMA